MEQPESGNQPDLDRVLVESDIVRIHMPLTDLTQLLIGIQGPNSVHLVAQEILR
ncbi:MAG TPA: hypothetical protein VG015_10215 [Candidatus Dormibacteraeota bacterium]|nr:hypothetical protein [Candidatus Dormibacteraeota bacterium]